MLKRIDVREDDSGACVVIKDAAFPSPFVSGLEYAPPVRGTWNIVHTGMLIPGAHEIFVCAEGCLRGVVLTAAEMGAQERFSTVAIRQNNVLDGDMEELIIEGVTDILNKLDELPPAVLVYTSCIHHFMGCDLERVYDELRGRFPCVAITDCYMNPIMRKSGLTPDELMRRQLYSLLEKRPMDMSSVNIIGNDFPTDENSGLVRLIRENGYKLMDITYAKTYEEYQSMAGSFLNITYNPAAKAAGEELEKRLGQRHLYLPLSYDYDEIEDCMALLSAALGVEKPNSTFKREASECALEHAKSVIGMSPIAIDYTVTFRPLSLARLLIAHGFNVRRVYLDSISGEEKEDFLWLKANSPSMKLISTVNVKMRFLERKTTEKMLAIGQKAAYFTGSDNFVNVVECGGYYGYEGIIRFAELMEDAFINKKDARSLIQIKGQGCGCCL